MSSDQTPLIEETKPVNNPNQKGMLLKLTVFLLIIAAASFAYWFVYISHYETTDNAYVSGNIIPVTSQVSGTVIKVNVNDTAYIKEGTPLVLLDPTDRGIALEKAKANLDLVLRETEQLYVKDRGLRATIQARELSLKQARNDLNRRQQAIHIGGVSQEELTHAQDNFYIAQSLLTTARAEQNANQVLINGTSLMAHPNVVQAIAQVKEAYLAFIRTTINAPISGYIAKRSVQVGQVVGAGSMLMAIVPLDEIWVDANFKEKQLSVIKPGQAVQLESDLYGSSMIYHGKVIGLSGGSGSVFSLLPAQNATGNWIKIVQRLPVRIALDKEELKKYPLRIGLSMRVTVDINQNAGSFVEARDNSSNNTQIYNNLDKEADPIIAKIIRDNLGGFSLSEGETPVKQEVKRND